MGQKRRVVQYYEKGERDGKSYDIPKYIRLACYALTKGVEDYQGPEEAAGSRAKGKGKGKAEGKHKGKDKEKEKKTKSKKHGKAAKLDGVALPKVKAKDEPDKKHAKAEALDIIKTKAKDEPERKRARK